MPPNTPAPAKAWPPTQPDHQTVPPMLSHLEALTSATTIEDVWELHVACMAEYGFDRLIYGYTRYRTPYSFGNLDDLLVLSNLPKQYLDRYIEEKMYHNAPMVHWSVENVGACSWGDVHRMLARGTLTEAQREVVEMNRQFGITAGYTVSFDEVSARAKGAIGLIAPEGMGQAEVDAVWQEKGREITLVNKITHMRITSLPFTGSRRALTARQREVLEWVGDGKTVQDIATIMGLTPTTVEKHLRLAREALDVETTAQAVLKASFQNQIFIMPSAKTLVWISGREDPGVR